MIIPVDICNRSTFSLCASDISCTFGYFFEDYTSQNVTIQSIAQVNDPVEVTEIIFFVRHLCLWTFHFFLNKQASIGNNNQISSLPVDSQELIPSVSGCLRFQRADSF